MNIIVISLERAVNRREKITKQLAQLGIEAVIMNAVDARILSDDQKDKKITLPGWFRCGETFNPGEIACTMSHIRALEIAKENGWEDVIILEDDAMLADDFVRRIAFLRRILPKNWEHVYLSGIPKIRGINKFFLQVSHLCRSVFTLCTHSMMVEASAYEKIIAKLSLFETTADDIYTHMITEEKSLRSYTYYPFAAYAEDECTCIWGHKQDQEHPSKQYFKNKCRHQSVFTAVCASTARYLSTEPRRLWRSKGWRTACKKLLRRYGVLK